MGLVERVWAEFASREDARRSDLAYYRRLSPQQRLDMSLELNTRFQRKEFVESLNSHGVEYVIVGAFALAFHGFPRYTGDIDILVGAPA